jgi:hypothetical protein
MARLWIALLLGAGLAAAVLGEAARAAPSRGRPRTGLGAVCAGEIRRFCPGRPGRGRVSRCLKAHREELNADCRTALEQAEAQRRPRRARPPPEPQ